MEEPVNVFEGVVTKAIAGDCGIYELNNKKITLVTSTLCGITNVRRLRQGDRVSLYNCHLVENDPDYGTLLVTCVRSYVLVDNLNDSENHLEVCKMTGIGLGQHIFLWTTVGVRVVH